MKDKKSLRKEILHIRNSLDINDRDRKSKVIFDHFKMEVSLDDISDILIFVDYKSEVITRNFIKDLLDNTNINVHVPKVVDNEMIFYKIESFNELKFGYMNILEPEIKRDDYINCFNDKAIIIIPGAVFDMDGHRIGYGGGYYDRFLSKYNDLQRIGICYDFQLLEENIPYESHDAILDKLITEKRIIKINE